MFTRLRSFGQAWWREVTTVGPHHHAHWPALRVGICVTAPLAAVLSAGHLEWASFVVFGSVCSVYGKQNDYRTRLHLQAGAGLALAGSVAAGSTAGAVAPGSLVAVLVMALASIIGFVLGRALGWFPPPSLFLVFAAGTLSSYAHPWSDVPLSFVLALAAAAFSVAVGQVGQWVPTSNRPRRASPPRTPLVALLASREARIMAALHALGPLIAGAAAAASGIGHPYWAAVSATVPLVGATLAAQVARGTLRFAGTVVGVGVAAALLALQPPVWVLVIALAAFQVITELFVARNYGVAVVAITPMALILTHLASPVPLGQLVSDRVLETLLGAATTVALLVVSHRALPPRRAVAA